MGPRWSHIAARFPGRTVSSLRNRFLRISAGEKLREAGTITKNRCQLCGKPKKGHICTVKFAQSLAPLSGNVLASQSAAPASAPAAALVELSQQHADDSLSDIPVATASIAMSDVLQPMNALPPHMLVERRPVGHLPTPSPLAIMRPAFTFSNPSALAEASELSDGDVESQAVAAIDTDDMMNGDGMVNEGVVAPSAVPPHMLMVDVGLGSDDEREKPPTPAAA